MDTTAWQPVMVSMDDQTGFVSEYCMPYRDGYFYLSYCYDIGNEWSLYYAKVYEFEYEDLILEIGFESLESAQQYFKKNILYLLDMVDCFLYGE